jgi:hypothetical protein
LATSMAVAGPVTLYSNGTIGTAEAFGITGSTNLVSDSFTLTASATITMITFSDWIIPVSGATPEAVQWDIGSSAFGSDLGSAADVTLSSTLFCADVDPACDIQGFDIYSSSFGLDVSLAAGTYWLTLENATASDGTDGSWGTGFTSGGSAAEVSDSQGIGNIPSEFFQIDGVTTPEPGSLALGGAGLVLLAAAGRCFKQNNLH